MRNFWSVFGVDVLAVAVFCIVPVLLRGEPLPSSDGPGESYAEVADAATGEIGEHLFTERPAADDEVMVTLNTMNDCGDPPGVPEPATLLLGLTALGAGLGARELRKRRNADV